MPSWQQKSAKKASKMCFMFGPNYTLLTLKWRSIKTKKSYLSWKMYVIEFKRERKFLKA